MNIGSKSSAIKYIDISELSSELTKPFQVQYDGSKVSVHFICLICDFEWIREQLKITGAAFSDNDAVWSANFKRSMASLFQIQMEEDSFYSSQEVTIGFFPWQNWRFSRTFSHRIAVSVRQVHGQLLRH